MLQTIGWHSTGAVCLLLTMAFIDVTRCEENLCNKLKSGESTILAMGKIEEKELVILDTNYDGYKVPFLKLQDETGSPYNGIGTPSLDLHNASPLQLSGTKSMTKRGNSKNAFIFNCYYQGNRFYPWIGNQLALFWPELKQVITVPLGKDIVRTYSFARGSMFDSDVFFNNGKRCNVAMLLPKKNHLVNRLVDLVGVTMEKNSPLIFNISVLEYDRSDIYLNLEQNHVDGGFIWEQSTVFAFNNMKKTMLIFEPDKVAIKVPFNDFFKCEPGSGPVAGPILGNLPVKSSSMMILCTAGGLVVLALIVVIALCFMLGKYKTKGAKSSVSAISKIACKKSSKKSSKKGSKAGSQFSSRETSKRATKPVTSVNISASSKTTVAKRSKA